MHARSDLKPYRVNAWTAPPKRYGSGTKPSNALFPEPGLQAHFAMAAAFKALGLTITDGIVRPEATIVHLAQDIPIDAVITAGYFFSKLSHDANGSIITLHYRAEDVRLADILSMVSKLGNLIAAHGGQPDTATALDAVIDIYDRT